MGEAAVETPAEAGTPAAQTSQFADPVEQAGMAPQEPGEDEAPRIPGKKPGAKPGEGAQERQEAPKKAKLKIADRELELDEEVAALLKEPLEVYEKRKEHTRAANDAFQKAAKLREDYESRYGKEALQEDPFAVFRLAAEAGIDPTQLVAAFARQALEAEKMTPEQRAFEQRKAELAEREQKLQAETEKREQERHAKEVDAFRRDFAKNVAPALAKYDLPDDDITVGEIGRRVAAQVRAQMPQDYESAAEDYADYLEQNIKRHLERLSKTPGALMKKYPEIAKRLREEDVASVRSPRLAVRPTGKQPAPEPIPHGQPKSWAEEEAEFRARRYGLKK